MPVSDDEARLRLRMASTIRERRERLWLTQEEAAERSGYSARHWQKLEAGDAGVTLDSLIRVSHVLRCSPADLLS